MLHGLKDYLTTKSKTIEKDNNVWLKINALLCSLTWHSIDPSPHPIYTMLQIVMILDAN